MNIKTLLPTLTAAVLLSACGSIVPKPQTDLFTIAKFESDNSIVSQISNPERQIIAYYDNNHRESAKPVKGGYYRMLLGRTAEGRAVIQDFYQDNGARQISPVIIPDDTKLKLSTPLEIGLNGKMAFYSRKGRLQSIGLYENGRVVEEWTYDLKDRPDGSLMYTFRHDKATDKTTVVDAHGNPASQELQDEGKRLVEPRMDELDKLAESDE